MRSLSLIGLGSATSGFAADNRIGVTIYKYDDNFMSLMRKEIDKEAKALGGIELLMNDSQNAQSIQNDQVDGLLSKGVKALAINLRWTSCSINCYQQSETR